jgi:hypothetical protein
MYEFSSNVSEKLYIVQNYQIHDQQLNLITHLSKLEFQY